MASPQDSQDLWNEWGTIYYSVKELPQGGLDLEEYVAEIETTLIKQTLQSTRYSQKRAADLLGLPAPVRHSCIVGLFAEEFYNALSTIFFGRISFIRAEHGHEI